ncbi:hypothetical protein ACYZUC_02925 [Pseudomonas sp. GT1P32]
MIDKKSESHTRIDGALIAVDNGNLKMGTGTLSFSNSAGKDKEHGYSLSVGGTYNSGGNGDIDHPAPEMITSERSGIKKRGISLFFHSSNFFEQLSKQR